MKLAMTTMVLRFMLDGPRTCTILCFNVHTAVEHLNRKVSVGQLLQHITKSVARSMHGQGQICSHITKKFVRLHNHCLLLTMSTSSYIGSGGQKKTF